MRTLRAVAIGLLISLSFASYGQNATIRLHGKVVSDMDSVSIEYMACTDSRCLPPGKFDFVIAINP